MWDRPCLHEYHVYTNPHDGGSDRPCPCARYYQTTGSLSDYWFAIQQELFPALKEELGPLGERYESLIAVLELVRVERLLPYFHGLPGRPQEDRAALARAFIAKAVFDITTTRALLERLTIDRPLRRLCGWSSVREVPSQATFSRAFAAFADSALPSRLHPALLENTMQDHLVGHISRDSTAIEGREKPAPKPPPPAPPKRQRGRPRKGEQRPPKEPRRLQRQQAMTLAQMVEELPTGGDVGTKRNAKGHQVSWTGYKLHLDAADGGIPLSCMLTSASLHDSQVAIPLAAMTAQRVTNRYDLMDSAYDASEIRANSESLGQVPIIDLNPRRNAALKREPRQEAQARRSAGHETAEDLSYRERTTVERVNGRLKDEFGARHIRVRGHGKVLCHLMFGVLALTVDQLLRLLN